MGVTRRLVHNISLGIFLSFATRVSCLFEAWLFFFRLG